MGHFSNRDIVPKLCNHEMHQILIFNKKNRKEMDIEFERR